MWDKLNVHTVPASRLSGNAVDYAASRLRGIGDIISSNSCECIARQLIEKPFRFQGSLWVAFGVQFHPDGNKAHAYRLVRAPKFYGVVMTYADKLSAGGGDAAREDPNGFYHGLFAAHNGVKYVVIGPDFLFTHLPWDAVTAETSQLALF